MKFIWCWWIGCCCVVVGVEKKWYVDVFNCVEYGGWMGIVLVVLFYGFWVWGSCIVGDGGRFVFCVGICCLLYCWMVVLEFVGFDNYWLLK